MTQQPFVPDMEKIKATSAKFKALCQRMDAHILVLDDMIAQLEEDYRRSPLYQYRLNRAKRLLNNKKSL
jgi:hypothetical protein